MTSTFPEPTKEELSMAKEIVLGSLAFALYSKTRANIESVQEFSELFNKVQKDSTPVTFEAIKTEGGIHSRLSEVSRLWEGGVHYLLRSQGELSKEDTMRMANGLRTLEIVKDALFGHLILFHRPHLRESILKSGQNPENLFPEGTTQVKQNKDKHHE